MLTMDVMKLKKPQYIKIKPIQTEKIQIKQTSETNSNPK